MSFVVYILFFIHIYHCILFKSLNLKISEFGAELTLISHKKHKVSHVNVYRLCKAYCLRDGLFIKT